MRKLHPVFHIWKHDYYIKPPRIRHREFDPFEKQLDGEPEAMKLCEDLGVSYNGEGPALWLYVRNSVQPHRDSWGRCFVLLSRGCGSLYTVRRNKVHELLMGPGMVVEFNDRYQHFWMSRSPCTLLVCNFRGMSYEKHYTRSIE